VIILIAIKTARLKPHQVRTILCLVPLLVIQEPVQLLCCAPKGTWTYLQPVVG